VFGAENHCFLASDSFVCGVVRIEVLCLFLHHYDLKVFVESPHRNSVQEAPKVIVIVDSVCFGYSQVVELILALRTDC
jgi:hypothetical protein